MTVYQEVALVAAREVRRNLKSIKGIVLCVLCVMGGVLAALIMTWLRQQDLAGAAENMVSPEQVKQFEEVLLTKRYGDQAMGHYLVEAPFVLLTGTFAGVWLAPLLIALVGFDSIPTDLQHRGVRYFTLRINRASYYVGKVIGLWLVVSVMMLFSHVVLWGVAIARGSATVAEVVSWGPRFWIVGVPIAAAWCGISQLIASQFKVPILALLVSFATLFGLWIVDAIGELSTKLHGLVYVYPNSYDAWLLSPHIEKASMGVLICLAFAATMSAVGALIFARRDV